MVPLDLRGPLLLAPRNARRYDGLVIYRARKESARLLRLHGRPQRYPTTDGCEAIRRRGCGREGVVLHDETPC
jgi:hypothetical protein